MIKATLEGLAEHLRDNGDLRADVDPAKVNLPGVWVSVGTISPSLLDGNGFVECWLYLIAKDSTALAVLEQLDELLDAVVELVDTEGDVITASVILPDNPAPMPAYRISVLRPYTRNEEA